MKWTMTAYNSFLDEQAGLWIERPDLHIALDSIDREIIKHQPELLLYLERSADRLGPHLWRLPFDELDVLLEVFPNDRRIQLIWLKPS